MTKGERVFSKSKIDNYIESYEKILSILKDIKNGNTTIKKACSDNGIDYLFLKNYVGELNKLYPEERRVFSDNEYFDIHEGTTFEEYVYIFAFNIDPNDVDKLYSIMPEFKIEETIDYVTKLILSKREREIFYKHFQDGMNMADIGKEYGITRSRVYQIICKSIRRLHTTKARELLKNGVFPSKCMDKYLNSEFNIYKKLESISEDIKVLKRGIMHDTDQVNPIAKNEKRPVYLSELDLSVRSYNSLIRYFHKNENIEYPTIFNILCLSEEELLKIRNLGMKSYVETMTKIANAGFIISRSKYPVFFNYICKREERPIEKH